jgi:hypothetical protein
MSLGQGQTTSHPGALIKILATRVPQLRELGVTVGNKITLQAHLIFGLRTNDRPTELLIK